MESEKIYNSPANANSHTEDNKHQPTTQDHAPQTLVPYLLPFKFANGEIPQFGDNDSGRLFRFPNTFKNRNVLDYRSILSAFSALFNENQYKSREFPLEAQIIKQLSQQKTLRYTPSYKNIKINSSFLTKLSNYKRTILTFNSSVNLDLIKFYYYPDFGLSIFKSDNFYLAISTISNSNMHHSWGHVHNDKLSFELYIDGEEIVRDPGSFCYTSDRKLRNEFRSTKAHHSIIVKGSEQNQWSDTDMGLFYLDREVRCKVIETSQNKIILEARYYGTHHIRSFIIKSNELIIDDYCNKSFIVNINRFKKYSEGYGIMNNKK